MPPCQRAAARQPQPKRQCPHCGVWRSKQTINRHMAQFRKAVSDSEAESDLDEASNSDDRDNAPAPAPNNMYLNPLADANPDPPADAEPDEAQPAFANIPFLNDLYRLLGNPYIALDERGSHIRPNGSEADKESVDKGSIGSDDKPPFIEQADKPRLDPDDKPRIDPDLLQEFLLKHLVELMTTNGTHSDRYLNPRETKMLELLATWLCTHFLRSTWDDLCLGVCAKHKIPSEFIAWHQLCILAGLNTTAYNCCINLCICYLGRFADFDACPFCGERPFNTRHKARQVFHYTPLIPQ
ncbi:hypothetical protein FRC07_002337 [Ceratobasidium sp. 392]|nr:hypothetical protein FRC07_002337 [Ceratobasidium sp. 392]